MVEVNGVFRGCTNGYYHFRLENDDIIMFEEVNKKVLDNYDLKSNELKFKIFRIRYQELFDNADDEDFLGFRLENIALI